MADPFVYLLVDGENIDRTLGQILDGKPRPDQRPRWEKVRAFVEKRWGRAARALFFLNASRGLPGSFIQALRVSGFIPIPLAGTSDQKVVDLAILKTLEALAARPGDVVLVSHDADFKAAFAALGDRRRRGLLALKSASWLTRTTSAPSSAGRCRASASSASRSSTRTATWADQLRGSGP
jgi:putative heme uptake system protein